MYTFNWNSQIKNLGRILSEVLDFTVSFSHMSLEILPRPSNHGQGNNLRSEKFNFFKGYN